MTTFGKTMFVILALGALFGATLALRSERQEPAAAPAQLTPAQLAEMQPPAPATPPKATRPLPPPQEEPAGPQELEFEDGNGS